MRASSVGADLFSAIITPEQVAQTVVINNAIIPDGTRYEEWVEKGKPDWNKISKTDIINDGDTDEQ